MRAYNNYFNNTCVVHVQLQVCCWLRTRRRPILRTAPQSAPPSSALCAPKTLTASTKPSPPAAISGRWTASRKLVEQNRLQIEETFLNYSIFFRLRIRKRRCLLIGCSLFSACDVENAIADDVFALACSSMICLSLLSWIECNYMNKFCIEKDKQRC